MDFDQLKTFREVWRLKSFSKAAEQLRITQPAVSAQIRSLEREMGERLFNRAGGKLSFTPAGKVFEVFAEDALDRQRHVLMMIGDQRRSPRGEIAISAQESTSLYVLPEVFAAFKRHYPKVSLKIVRAERQHILDAVINREVEFGVVSLPVIDSRLQVETIHRDQIVLVTPAAHPLTLLAKILPEDVARHPLLLAKAGRQLQLVMNVFRMYDIALKAAMEVESGELIKRFILAGLGIGFLPNALVREEVRAGTLAAIRLEFLAIPRDLGLIYLKGQLLTRAAAAFLDTAVHDNANDHHFTLRDNGV